MPKDMRGPVTRVHPNHSAQSAKHREPLLSGGGRQLTGTHQPGPANQEGQIIYESEFGKPCNGQAGDVRTRQGARDAAVLPVPAAEPISDQHHKQVLPRSRKEQQPLSLHQREQPVQRIARLQQPGKIHRQPGLKQKPELHVKGAKDRKRQRFVLTPAILEKDARDIEAGLSVEYAQIKDARPSTSQ